MIGGIVGYNGYVEIEEDYYKIGEESIVSVIPVKINDSIQFHDHIFDVNFSYVIDDKQIQILENKSMNTDGKMISPMWTDGTEFVWLYIGVRNEFYSCIQYNLETGEIRDIIKESGLPIVYSENIDGMQTTLSPNGKIMLIHDFKGQVFLLNIQDLSYNSLDAINAEDMKLSLSFIDYRTPGTLKSVPIFI